MNRFVLMMILFVLSHVYIVNASTGITTAQALSEVSNAGHLKAGANVLNRLLEKTNSEFIIEFRNGEQDNSILSKKTSSIESKKAHYRSVKDRVLSQVGPFGLEIVKDYSVLPMAFVRSGSREAIVEILNDNEVVAIYENVELSFNLNQSLPQIGQPQIESEGYIGDNTTVAILDTGVDFTRSAFGSCTEPGQPDCRVVDAFDTAPDDHQRDENGHGTNVAAIAAAVAPGAGILAIDVFNGPTAAAADIIQGINQVIALRNQFNIVSMNLSLGRRGVSHTNECTNSWASTPFAQARAAGIIPVVSAGNDGFTGGVQEPACAPGAVRVGAVDDNDRVASFSNSDDNLITLLAPGVNINAAGITMRGTSQAAPHIAGVIAVMRAPKVNPNVAPNDTLDQTIARMVNTGVQIRDSKNGLRHPRVDLFLAVQDALDDNLPRIDGQPVINSKGIVYYRGSNKLHRLWWTQADGWTDWNMGYRIAGDPVVDPKGVVYFRGTDNRLHRLGWTQAAGWTDWNMGYRIAGDPAIDSKGVVYFRGTDNRLHRLGWTQAAGWTDWNMGYRIAGDPVIGLNGIVYFRGTNNQLHRLGWTQAAGWTDWNMGYDIAGDPVVGPNGVVYFRGLNNRLHRLRWSQAAGWTDLDMGYSIIGDPAVDSNGMVYAQGTNNRLYRVVQ